MTVLILLYLVNLQDFLKDKSQRQEQEPHIGIDLDSSTCIRQGMMVVG
ncbi:hypothetical protein L2735_04365 [Shewanella olleyana]|nr:hypothetical protein [Shewanella olleyana]MCL1066040.1 hypothetical protein [Shewanella olleyana]